MTLPFEKLGFVYLGRIYVSDDVVYTTLLSHPTPPHVALITTLQIIQQKQKHIIT